MKEKKENKFKMILAKSLLITVTLMVVAIIVLGLIKEPKGTLIGITGGVFIGAVMWAAYYWRYWNEAKKSK